MERSGEVVLSGREVRPNVQLGYKSANVEMATNCRLTTDRILLSSSIQPTDYMISRIKMGGDWVKDGGSSTHSSIQHMQYVNSPVQYANLVDRIQQRKHSVSLSCMCYMEYVIYGICYIEYVDHILYIIWL